jgi:DNA polymerase-3 subunit gamma/tau
MAYQVLARKYRPQLFSDVVGQDHVTRTLLNALAQGRIAHGYIFSGHRGIGKTTIARILAAALNCTTEVGTPERPTEEPCRVCVNCREISSASRQESSLFEESHSFDVEEIDAATNRGIDDARLLTQKIQTRPTNKSKYKIIILDEAHQITDAAWNALLKTLEEPPEWAVFMFATTQPEDIPQTIRSRCQHFSFHAVKLDDIIGQLRSIAAKENITIDEATLSLLAEAGDGSMRDALSIMDQAIASAPLIDSRPHLEVDQVRELMGSVSNVIYEQVLDAVHRNNSADVLAIVNRLLDAGNSPPQLARQFVRYLRNAVVAKVTNLLPDASATGFAADLLQISPEERTCVARSATLFTEEELSRFLAIMLRTFDELGYRQEQRFHLELGLLKLVHAQRLVPIEELLSQLGTPPVNKPLTTMSSAASSSGVPSPASIPLSKAETSKALAQATGQDSPQASPRTALSPFETDQSRKAPAPSTQANAAQALTDGSLALAEPAATPELATAAIPQNRPRLVLPTPPPLPVFRVEPVDSPEIAAAESNLVSPQASAADINLEQLQHAVVSALASVKGQKSASEQIEESTFSIDGRTIAIQTGLSATMLQIVLNADAERIIKATLRVQGAVDLTLKLLPGTTATAAQPKPSRPPAVGSAADLAARHPVVQQARQLFNAEISRVIDLRDK